MKKRMLSTLLGFVLTCSILTGCSSNNADPVTTPTDTEAPEQTTSAEGDDQNTADQINIKWAVWDIASTTYYQPLIDAFEEKNPNITVEMVDLGSQDYMTALATQLAGSDTDLDVVLVKDIPGYSNLVSKKVLEPVDITKIDSTQYGGITEQIMVENQLYALPFRSDFWVIFYNKDIFDEAGVEYPSNDMSFERYDELARQVSKHELGNEVFGSHYHIWRSTIQLFGILDGEHSMVDGNYDFLKPYYEMVLAHQSEGICQDYATLKTSNLHYSGAFAQGNVAMMNMGSWFIPTLIDKIEVGEYTEISNWGLVKYPHADGVEPGSTIATITTLGVTSASKNKEAAALFMHFVGGVEGAEVIAKTGTFPAIKTDAVIEAIAGIKGFPADEGSKMALETANTYLEMPLHEFSSRIEVVLNEGHDYIMTGTKTLDEGIRYMNEEVSKILQ